MPEDTRQREAFDAYWALGAERSIELLRQSLAEQGESAPGVRTLYSWSSRYRWRDRITQLEREAREAGDQAKVAALEEMYERQAKLGLLLQQTGAEWLTQQTEEVSPEAAVRAVTEGAKLERLARGEPTERTALQGEVDVHEQFEEFSDDELRLLAQEGARLLARARREESD